MADITISDLELAPALADDMVFPVENTTDTYAATLAMLRRLINKTFVEVENSDFNALTDDGFYQCTGTPTNSPVAGAINWTLQVSAENGVVVQRAFSLDDSFANLYIRRWNGVTWTGWLEVGAGALDNKANINLDNLSLTGQAKFDGKANVDLSNLSAAGQAVIGGKANVDLSNVNSTGKATAVDWGMPNYAAGSDVSSSVFTASGVGFKATRRGVCLIRAYNSAGTSVIYLYSGGVLRLENKFNTNGYAGSSAAFSLVMNTGDSVRIYPCAGSVNKEFWAVFYPYKGA